MQFSDATVGGAASLSSLAGVWGCPPCYMHACEICSPLERGWFNEHVIQSASMSCAAWQRCVVSCECCLTEALCMLHG